MDRISLRRLAPLGALGLVLALILLVAAATAPASTGPVFPAVGSASNASSQLLANPSSSCKRRYARADFHGFAKRAFDGRWRTSSFERETLDRIIRCQRYRKSKPVLRTHRERYRASHLDRLWTQGVGRLNRVFPAHGLYEPGEFISFTAVRRTFEAAGATPAEGYEFATIARGESGGGKYGGYPGILGIDGWVVPGATSVGIGLVQCTPAVWGALALNHLAKLARSTSRVVQERALRNPLIQAQMAMALYRWGGNSYSAWFGTRYFAYAPAGIRSALTKADRRWLKLGGMGRLRTE